MKRGIPSLNWLRVFEAAARMESFARAAELLNMSTSAVSQQIKALESHFGEDLFKRGPRHVELTDAGHAFLPTVRQSLKSVEETAASLFGQDKDNTLTLQADLSLTLSWLTDRLPAFSRRHPQIQLHLNGAYHDPDYQRPGFELRILFGPVHRSWGQCDRLYDEVIYPVASPAIADSIRTADDFLQHRLMQISTHQVNWNQVLQAVAIDSVPTRQLCFTDSTQVSLNLAAAEYGIALARAPTTNRLVARLGLKPCRICPRLQSTEAYYLSYRNLESLSGAAREFRHWLLAEVSGLCA
ncbi:MAG TPA: LysR family transcriptional regulator [Gammaproteobacteria bacterium]|nr:LysR family transcriptional regulator [Gammaproteobacteria bacterium]